MRRFTIEEVEAKKREMGVGMTLEDLQYIIGYGDAIDPRRQTAIGTIWPPWLASAAYTMGWNDGRGELEDD